MIKRVVFSGGGSGGHVIPALTLIEELQRKGFLVEYIGSKNGIESEFIPSKNIPYYGIHTGKLRRYFSIQNFVDIFKIILGTFESFIFLLKRSSMNTLVFSTGGFVSVPVVIAAKMTGKKVFIHEQTSRVGLANMIASKFADKVFISFEESFNYFPKSKTVFSGYPLRDSCYLNEISEIEIEGIDLKKVDKPVLFITGGGNGAQLLNEKVRDELEILKEKYFIVHQVGKRFLQEYKKFQCESYLPLGFIGDEMIDLFKLSKVVISRAGAGTVCELMSLNKRSIFVPLKIAQRNEQYHNAMEASKKIGSLVVEEDKFKETSVYSLINQFESTSFKKEQAQVVNGKKILIAEIEKLFSSQ